MKIFTLIMLLLSISTYAEANTYDCLATGEYKYQDSFETDLFDFLQSGDVKFTLSLNQEAKPFGPNGMYNSLPLRFSIKRNGDKLQLALLDKSKQFIVQAAFESRTISLRTVIDRSNFNVSCTRN